jgi:hypothetical protein
VDAAAEIWPIGTTTYIDQATSAGLAYQYASGYDRAMAESAIRDLRGERILRVPPEVAASYLEHEPSLTSLHIAAAMLEGKGMATRDRVANTVAQVAARQVAVVEDVWERRSEQLLLVARRFVGHEYGRPQANRQYDVVPFLWAGMLERAHRANLQRLHPSSYIALANRFMDSYEATLTHKPSGTIPEPLSSLYARLNNCDQKRIFFTSAVEPLRAERETYVRELDMPKVVRLKPEPRPPEGEALANLRYSTTIYNKYLHMEPHELDGVLRDGFRALRANAADAEALEDITRAWAVISECAGLDTAAPVAYHRLVGLWGDRVPHVVAPHISSQIEAIAAGRASTGVVRLAADMLHPDAGLDWPRMTGRELSPSDLAWLRVGLSKAALAWFHLDFEGHQYAEGVMSVACEAYARNRLLLDGNQMPQLEEARNRRLVRAEIVESERTWRGLGWRIQELVVLAGGNPRRKRRP